MQLIITDPRLARTRVVELSAARLGVIALFALAVLIAAAALLHLGVSAAARHGWSWAVAWVGEGAEGEPAARERFLRENLDLMARKLGELEARITQLDALGERVSGLAGVHRPDLKAPPGRGGVLIPGPSLTLSQLQDTLDHLEAGSAERLDLFTVIESRLMEQRLRSAMIPTAPPVHDVELGSRFGWRIDPFTGRSALHTGVDFAASPGTPILAAAGGVVVAQEYHPEYGNMIEIDHGNQLVSRYAHASRVFVHKGDMVRRGQKIAEVGSTGRSTGPHLHFEVLVQGVPQDPMPFLSAGAGLAKGAVAQAAAAAPAPPAQQVAR